MTPDKGKKPLPSSTSVVFIEQPKTQYEWRYVLKVIKLEYQKGQWKQCLLRCNQLLHRTFLPLPLHLACLHFYAALSEEAIARQMHNMSMAKIQALQHAKSCFEQAVSSLPMPEKRTDCYDSSFTDSGSDIDDTASLEDSVSSVEGPHEHDEATTSPIPKKSEQPSPAICVLRPLPLQICKVAQTANYSFNEKRAFFEARLRASGSSPPMTPASKVSALEKPLPATPSLNHSLRKLSNPRPTPISRSDSTNTSFISRTQERYNEQLQDFAEMLAKHIYFVDETITKTQEAQETGRCRLIKDRKSNGNDEDENGADLRARIARLKAKGWIRERFVPGKYQELCERALSDL